MPNINELCPGFGEGQYLKSSELPPTGLLVTIAGVTVAALQERDGVRNKPVLQLVGQPKGLVLNVINSRMLEHLFGRDYNTWTGKTVLLVSEPVQGPSGMTTGIRIRAASTPSGTASAPAPATPAPAPATPAAAASAALEPAAALAALSPEQLQALFAKAAGKMSSWSD